MILYLVLSIISSTCLLIILKSFYFWKVDTLHGIIFNYWTAAFCSFLVTPGTIISQFGELKSLWYVTAAIGFLFIVVFFITGKTTQISGVGVASVASKMSMVIPIISGILLYNESAGSQKILGILIAVPAVILVSRPSVRQEGVRFRMTDLGLPVLLFFGAGFVDTAIKYTQHHFMDDNNRQLVIMAIFGCAGTFGLIRLAYELKVLNKKLSLRSIGGGILLGVTNYLSLYFLLKCLSNPESESSTVFAYVNIGVVVSSFLVGIVLFGEKAERNKVIGVLLSLIAIIILSY